MSKSKRKSKSGGKCPECEGKMLPSSQMIKDSFKGMQYERKIRTSKCSTCGFEEILYMDNYKRDGSDMIMDENSKSYNKKSYREIKNCH